MNIYDKLIQYLNSNRLSGEIREIKKNDTIRQIVIESLGDNTDTITVEFDSKNNILEMCLTHDVETNDELRIYRNISKANMMLDDGVIVYLDGKLILRNISDSSQIQSIETILKKIAYLQIVATTYFSSIVSLEEPEKKVQKDDSLLNKNIEKILAKMKENTKTECIYIRTKISKKQLPLTASKFGGFPYWPNNRADYPKTSKGIPLTMLAQINFSDLPENNIFPNKGLLQFYVWNLDDWDNYRVVLHKDCTIPASPYLNTLPTSFMPDSAEIKRESGEKITVPNIFWGESGMFPVAGEMALEFSKRYEPVNPTENCFETEFKKAAKQLNIQLPDKFDVFSDLPKNIHDEFYAYGCGHKILGRPCFVQYDYRETEDNEKDILLFQMDSAWSDSGETDNKNFINFGDAGTAGFFIKKEDLKNLDFSNVYYDWACY